MDTASQLKEIKARLPLSTVIGERVELKGRSPHFTGLCPFHQEKTPSFHVRDNVARFKCFGCGVGGDVVEFVMRARGIGFVEAVQDLAIKAGIVSSLPRTQVVRPGKEKTALFAQKVAHEFFVAELAKMQPALDYLRVERGLGERMIKQAGLGFGGASREQFRKFLRDKGISDELAIEAGLLKQGRYSLIPQFYNRITFPIRNHDGVIVGFGGRTFLEVDKDAPKYVNTHSYAHYEKRKSFYGWHESKSALQKGSKPVIVEGYFDAMALWASGAPALALCGTALTDEHLKLIRTMSTQVILGFDRDSAGLNALRQALVLLYRLNMEPSLLILDHKDAGDYLALRKLAELKAKLASQNDALCYVIDQGALLAQESVIERVHQIDLLLPIFVSMKRQLVRRQYAAYLAKRLHEQPEIVWAEIERKFKTVRVAPSTAASLNDSAPSKRQAPRVMNPNDRFALEIALSDPSLVSAMTAVIDYLSSEMKDLLVAFGRCYESDVDMPIDALLHKAVQICEPTLWQTLQPVMHNRIVQSAEEARASLAALEQKLAGQSKKASIKKKRLEIEGFARKKDYVSALSSLKEKSELLGTRKSATAKPVEKPPRSGEKTTVPQKIPKKQKISDLGADESFFNVLEDW